MAVRRLAGFGCRKAMGFGRGEYGGRGEAMVTVVDDLQWLIMVKIEK